VDEHGIPLSIIVTGANRHDVTQVANVLEAKQAECSSQSEEGNNICADAGYASKQAEKIMKEHGYIPHIKGRAQEAKEKKDDPSVKARRWIVEVSHSWFNRFRKLLVRYEKLARSFLALNHLAAAIIAFRKIKGSINIIYG
jgi:IS5 family transposase